MLAFGTNQRVHDRFLRRRRSGGGCHALRGALKDALGICSPSIQRDRRRTPADRALVGGASRRRAHSSWYSCQCVSTHRVATLRLSSSAVLSQGYSVSARSISRKSPLRRRLTPRISAASWAFTA